MRKTAIEQFGEWARRGIEIINALYHDPKCFTEFQSEIEREYSRGAMVLMQERVTEELF